MQSREFCVYNETRDNFLIPRVTVIDSKSEPLKLIKVLIEGLASDAETGLWLQSLNNVPQVPRLSPFDLVYLDQDRRVVNGVELVPSAEFPRFNGLATSALVLPFRTFSTSRALPGDQVVFQAAKEIEPLLGPGLIPESPVPMKASPDSSLLSEPLHSFAEKSIASEFAEVPSAQPEASIQRIEPIGTVEPADRKGVSLRVPFLSSLARLNINISVSIAVTHLAGADPSVDSRHMQPAPPVHVVPARGNTYLQPSLRHAPGSSAPTISTAYKSLKAGYLRWADRFVYGPSRLSDRVSKRLVNSTFLESLRNDLAVQWFRTWFQP